MYFLCNKILEKSLSRGKYFQIFLWIKRFGIIQNRLDDGKIQRQGICYVYNVESLSYSLIVIKIKNSGGRGEECGFLSYEEGK